MLSPTTNIVHPDQQLQRLRSVVAAGIARRCHAQNIDLAALSREARVEERELWWALEQNIDMLTLSRLVRIAVAIGCEVSIEVR